MEFKIGGKVRLKKTIAYSDGDVPNGTICVLAKTSDLISEIIDPLGRKWTITTESIEPVILAIDEIISKEMSCVIHTKTKEEAELLADYMPQTNSWSRNPCDDWDYYGSQTGYYIADGKLAQYASISYYKANFPEYGEIYEFSDLFATGGRVSIHDIPTSEWYNPMRLTFKNGSSIEALPQKDDTVRGKNHFCDGFRGGKIPTPEKPVSIEEQLDLPKGVSIHDLPTSEWYRHFTVVKDEIDALKHMANNVCVHADITDFDAQKFKKRLADISARFKEEKKMPTKFTFYVTDWVDINKTNGEKIPMKRTVAYIGSNTDVKADTSCPVAEYDERIGCLIAAAKISAKKSNEAKMMYNIARSTWGTELSWAILFELANAAFNDNFERAYKKFHNDNIRFEKKRLTCTYCGKVFDTVEEKQEHEAWHVERKKSRRERYLLRKRAKEIAFEEQAQKMAKEMMGEQK